ncbi:acyl-CoA thioesterase-1 [Pedobacter psychrotolerans]|uniref:Acyl-CoA thioesterase-1 n=2 Tax=Pedobacter psychrotolerans TaxID=1843235 RepID=A0A4R2HKX9_9SPHI|nr:arylesterase [Pedobacter psychrotolerans]TCO30727.1 acyl-CoA thioesterase-1 [Pedobacter psychrotolerans]
MMLRKRLTGLFVLAMLFAACGNKQSKVNSNQTLDSVDQSTSKANDVKVKNILFFGTSLTAGYGLDPTEAYPALIQNRIDSLKMPYKVINGGLSGETSAAGKSRISWLLKQPIDVFVLELGANDGLRGLPVAQTTKNLQSIIDSVKTKYPNVKMVMAGMQVPPNMGAKYAEDFKNIFPNLAKKNNMALVPFLLDKVGGVPKLNQEDGIHPTAEGDKILAENVWVILKDVLESK